MPNISWRRVLAVPTALTLTLGGALLVAAPAHAADAFAVTSPAQNSANVAQNPRGVVAFTGTGLPTADDVDVTYVDAANVSHQGSFSSASNDGAGNWTQNENFNELSTGQTTVVATVTAVDAQTGNADTTVPVVTQTFTLAVAPNPVQPFTVTTPVSNSTTPVASTTPTFSGTGATGDTITITYGARAGGTGTAGTTTVGADGTWTVPTTDFSQLEPGQTAGSAIVTETDATGAAVPGAPGQRINFVFPAAPAPAIASSLTLSPTTTTVDEAASTGIAVGATGFSPDEQVIVKVTDASGKQVTLAGNRPAETFASATDGSYTDDLLLPAASIGGDFAVTITGVRSGVVVKSSFFALAAPVITAPVNGQKLVGDTVTFTGTGTPGSDIGLLIAPTAEFQAALKKEQASGATSMKSAQALSRNLAPLAQSGAKATSPAADPNARIIVAANGTWSVTLAAKPGDYTVVAISAVLDADGNVVTSSDGATPLLAGPSNAVEFVLTAAVVTTSSTGGTGTLAYTGSNAEPFVVSAGLLLLIGAGLMIVARRRKSLQD